MDRLSEWRDAFDYLRERDDLSSSWIDLPSLTLLVRALGFPQVTKESITHMVRKEVGKRQKESKNYDDFLKQYTRLEKTVGIRINFELFCDVMEELMHDRDVESETQTAFQLFDYENTGYITSENVFQTYQKLKAMEIKDNLNTKIESIISGTKDEIESMIEMLDSDLDGKISFAEFKNIWKRKLAISD